MAEDVIDPRYAPQFQRGFDPTVHPVVVTEAPASTRDAPVRLPGGPPASAVRVDQLRPQPPSPPIDRHPVEPEPVAGAEPTSAGYERADAGARWREWLLLVAGVVLLVVAAAMFWSVANDTGPYVGMYEPANQALIVVRNGLPGPLLVAAVAAISAWILLRALRSRE